EYQRNNNKEKTSELISNPLVEETISASLSSTQGMCIDKHPKNSTTEEQQDISRTNENNSTHGSVLKRTEDMIPNTENSNKRKNLETQNVDLTSNSTSNKETAQEVTSSIVIIDNNNYELQELNHSEEEYITATNKRKKDKKKVSAQKQEETRTAFYKKKTRNESQSMQI
ncbi:2752_t:CDS:1, partial [Scutellospora calospora]